MDIKLSILMSECAHNTNSQTDIFWRKLKQFDLKFLIIANITMLY